MAPPSDSTAPLNQQLVELEHALRIRLRGVQLVLEAGLDTTTLAQTSTLLRRLSKAPAGERILTTKLPATLAVHLVGTGAMKETRTFWDEATFNGAFHPQQLGEGFEWALAVLKLERFEALADENALRFIAPILAHGGIPRYSADAFVDVLVASLRRFGLTSASDLIALWRSRQSALDFGHKSIRRFLLHGGAPAVDYLSRCLELVRATPEEIADLDPSAFGLPNHVVEAYLRYVGERPERRSGGTPTGRYLPRPRVMLDPFDSSGPAIELPPIATASGRGTWLVDDGSDIRSYRTSALDTQRVPLRPAGYWNVELRLDDGGISTTAFEATAVSPCIVFDPRTGTYIDDIRPIPLEECWILAPAGSAFEVTNASGSIITARFPSVLPTVGATWEGYTVTHLALDGVAAVRVSVVSAIAGVNRQALLRVAGQGTRPRLLDEPVAGLTSADGAMVFAACPRVLVPVIPGYDDARWSLTVAWPGHRQTIGLADMGRAGEPFDVASIVAAASVATIELSIRGPLGSDFRARLVIVPGLRVELPPSLLIQGDEHGRQLRATASEQVRLQFPPFTEADGAATRPVPGDTDRVELIASRAMRSATLLARFPRLLWAIRNESSFAALGASKVRIDAQAVMDGSAEAVVVSTMRPGIDVRLALEDGAEVLQYSDRATTAPPDGRWAFPLSAFRDTVTASSQPRLTLALEITGRRVVVGDLVSLPDATNITAATVASGEATASVEVSFTDLGRRSSRVIRLWSKDRPWLGPVVATVGPDSDSAKLEDVPIGRYRAEIAADDPWFAPTRPVAGARSTGEVIVGDPAMVVRAAADLAASDSIEARIALILMTGTAPRAFSGADLLQGWELYLAALRTSIADAAVDRGAAKAAERLADLIRSDARTVLIGLAAAVAEEGLDRSELARIHVAIGPILARASLPPLPEQSIRTLWRTWPPIAAQVDVPGARSGDADAIERCLEYAAWSPGADGDLPLGRGPSVNMLAAPGQQLRVIADFLGLLPSAVLTWDTFQMACIEWLIAMRTDPKVADRWAQQFGWLADSVPEATALDRFVSARRGVQHPDYRWADGLRSSLAAAAHFVSGADTSALAGQGLLELLRLAPLLVMHDLTLAACVVSPADADLVRSVASVGLPEPERQWRELEAAMASQVDLPCRVVSRNGSGVIVRVLGHSGRIRTHELAWRAEDRADAPDIGDSVHAVVIDLDEERRRVELSVRRGIPGPWDADALTLSPGDRLDVTVTRVVPFGVFTTTPSGLDGLIHVTELPDAVSQDGDGEPLDLEERYPVGTVLRARVLDIRPDVEELSLSMRDPDASEPTVEAAVTEDVDRRTRED